MMGLIANPDFARRRLPLSSAAPRSHSHEFALRHSAVTQDSPEKYLLMYLLTYLLMYLPMYMTRYLGIFLTVL